MTPTPGEDGAEGVLGMGVAQRHVMAQLMDEGVIAAVHAGHTVAIGGGVGVEGAAALAAPRLVAHTADIPTRSALWRADQGDQVSAHPPPPPLLAYNTTDHPYRTSKDRTFRTLSVIGERFFRFLQAWPSLLLV